MDLTQVGFKIRTATVGYDLLDQEKKPVLIYDNEPNPPTYTPNMAQFSHHLTDGSSPFEIILAGDSNTTALGTYRLLNTVSRGIPKVKGTAATNYTGWALDEFDTTVTQINQSATHQRRMQNFTDPEPPGFTEAEPVDFI